jgi:hypothetical protein
VQRVKVDCRTVALGLGVAASLLGKRSTSTPPYRGSVFHVALSPDSMLAYCPKTSKAATLNQGIGKGGKTMAITGIYERLGRLVWGLDYAHAARILQARCRSGLPAALYTIVLLTCSNFALAANPEITAVTFTGPNTDLHIVVSGTGFGTAPRGIPCTACSTPYLRISDGRGYGCQIFNIKSWTDSGIVVNRFQGNPGDKVLVVVTNPQSHLVGISGQFSVPKTIILRSPTIGSVSFAGGVGRNLEMTVLGSGFGASPPGLPFDGDLPFFSFTDKPFELEQWNAGYTTLKGGDSVSLNYALWLDNRIVIVGFGGEYGTHDWKVSPNDTVAIAVANTSTCGLNMNAVNPALGPTSIGAIWGGHLP